MRRVGAAIAALGIAACAAVPGTEGALDAELHARRAELMRALREHDGVALEGLLAKDFVFVHSTGVRESREQFIARALRGPPPPQLEFLEDSIRVYPGPTVVWSTRSRRVPVSTGEAFEFVATDVLVKEAGAWRWVAVQSTRVIPR